MAFSDEVGELSESVRRKEGASGVAVRLANGERWLLATPQLVINRVTAQDDRLLEHADRLLASAVLRHCFDLEDLQCAAGELLLANYRLSRKEVVGLLTLGSDAEWHDLASELARILFGASSSGLGYGDWVRGSLLANGLGNMPIPLDELGNVLSILVATGRTVPLERFVEAFRIAQQAEELDRLI